MTGPVGATPGNSSGMAAGFDDYTFDSQSVFRTLLDAMSRPGTIGETGCIANPTGPIDPATVALALSLFDHDTAIWLGDIVACVEVYEYLRFHCGCPVTKSSLEADFAIVTAAAGIPGFAQFDPGTDTFPDRSTTLIVQVEDMENGPPVRLTGPGIEKNRTVGISGLPEYFWRERREQQEIFPRGIDLIFACGTRIAALPRSTVIEV